MIYFVCGNMIELIRKEQLPICLDILKKSYENTAETFGMTEENCPYRGRTRLPLYIFEKEFDDGYLMYGYIHDNQVVGFLSVLLRDGELCIQDIAILPDHQNNGYGSELFLFAKEIAINSKCKRISLGMVYDNIQLRKWYQNRGFHTINLVNFEKVRYTVGIMELSL